MADDVRPNLLPPPIEQYLRAWVLRQWRLSLVRALGRAVAIGVVGALICCLADRLWRFPQAIRAALLGCLLLAMVVIVARILFSYRQGRRQWLVATLWAEKLDPS